jgi:glucokinase
MIAIGVDLGGSKLSGGLVDEQGRVAADVRRPTPRSSAEAIVSAAEEVFAELLAQTSKVVVAAGVAIAGLVDIRAGRVVEAVNLPLAQVPLAEILEQRFDLPVVVENDGKAAALAEHLYGAARGSRSSLTLTLGTGVGGGVVLDGALLRDPRGTGFELGHVVVDADGPRCQGGCPTHGCLETLVSGTAIVRLAQQRGRAGTDAYEVFSLARGGDLEAEAIIRDVGSSLGAALSSFANLFNPHVFVIGGGVGLSAPALLLAEAKREFRGRTLRANARARLVRAALADSAPLIGAPALALAPEMATA